MAIGAAALLSIPQIVEGFVANGAHKKQASLMDSLMLDMPDSMIGAENIMRSNANTGLVGYEKRRADVLESIPQTVNSYKDVVGNPAAILGALSDTQTSVNDALSELAIADSAAMIKNKAALADFLTTKSQTETNISTYNNNMKIQAGEERMKGVSELIGGINSGLSTGLDVYSGLTQLKADDDYMEMLKKYLGIQ